MDLAHGTLGPIVVDPPHSGTDGLKVPTGAGQLQRDAGFPSLVFPHPGLGQSLNGNEVRTMIFVEISDCQAAPFPREIDAR